MADLIYQVDSTTQTLARVDPVSFSAIGLKERSDLQEWIIGNPELLGEPLLIIASEFSGFEGSKRRPDIIALDENGILTIVELKLDTKGSHADLQAIRYAAFCSTITMSDALNMLAEFDGSSNDEASLKICGFLQSDDLPELDNRPRIILAAGSMDDQELTSSVLWLRGFNVDITCVELAPYRIPESGKFILVPRVVIPIPEARDFLINVERKEVAQVQRNKDKSKYAPLWRAVADEFNVMNTPLTASGRASGSLMRANIRHPYVHYEWNVRILLSSLSLERPRGAVCGKRFCEHRVRRA